jgi:multidrug efflux pump subunit AcrB
MMSAYFPEPGNWLHPSLYAEIQPTGWIYDGGILMCVFYPAALFVAMRYTYKVAIDRHSELSDPAMLLFVVQLLVLGLCFTGPVFNTQIGIMFWLATAMLYGCHRTIEIQNWQAAVEAEEAAAEADG